LDYHLKYADRSALNKLAELRGDCDEILIVKDGQITDTSFSNVVFTDGQQFVTPSSYLLPGTMRAALLQSGAITEAPIRTGDLQQFSHVTLINAMLPLHAFPLIPISSIH
jgi:4-amino-4-deoxychorismate lyase